MKKIFLAILFCFGLMFVSATPLSFNDTSPIGIENVKNDKEKDTFVVAPVQLTENVSVEKICLENSFLTFKNFESNANFNFIKTAISGESKVSKATFENNFINRCLFDNYTLQFIYSNYKNKTLSLQNSSTITSFKQKTENSFVHKNLPNNFKSYHYLKPFDIGEINYYTSFLPKIQNYPYSL